MKVLCICFDQRPDLKGTETSANADAAQFVKRFDQRPDLKGTETLVTEGDRVGVLRFDQRPDLKGTETKQGAH